MHRTDAPYNAAGLYTEGDPGLGVPRTIVGAKHMNAIQEELCGVVEGSGIALDALSNGQLLLALLRYLGKDQYVDVTAAIAMTALTPPLVLATPAAAYTQALPTTNVKKGQRWKWVNLSATAGRNVTINSSGGNLVWLVCPGNECELIALQDTPTTAAHWALVNRGWPLSCRVHKSTGQLNLTETTATKVTFDTVLSDRAGMFDDANDRIIFPVPGRYRVNLCVHAAGVSAGMTLHAIAGLNGNSGVGGGRAIVETTTGNGATAFLQGELVVAAADYTEGWVNITDANGVNVVDIFDAHGSVFPLNKSTSLSVEYIGPA